MRLVPLSQNKQFAAGAVLIFIGFAIVLPLVLSGCASDSYWWQEREASPKPWLYVTVSDPDKVCRGAGSLAAKDVTIWACAQPSTNGCVIFGPENPPAWLVEHEENHCKGMSHDRAR